LPGCPAPRIIEPLREEKNVTASGIPRKDREILRTLGREAAAAAGDPVNDDRREVRRRVNDHERGRPWIAIYQEPWSELNADGELDLRCRDEFCRGIELDMRRTLYRWRHYPGDMTIDAVSFQPQCIHDTGFGIEVLEDTRKREPEAGVASHHYHAQIRDEADIAKIREPVVTHDEALTEELYQKRSEVFDGVLEVRKGKTGGFWFNPWDQLVRWTGVQNVLMDMALRPKYVHKLIGRLVRCWNRRLDQYEEQGLLSAPVGELTCSAAAQVFSEVSPAMHGELALQYEARFLKRFKRVYYGCCEPLHDKVDICAEHLPNLYKISMSPWVDFPVAVRNVRDRFIFAWKPNPAFLAYDQWDPDLVRADIRKRLGMAVEGGCFVEIHLKDISTVRNEPRRLTEWERIAKEEAERCVA
jgi:hypothetical protein